jgi:N-acetylglucosaminyl-diphospho-decaprenol L-rhamnosyltransferase
MAERPPVTIAVVSWNTRELLDRCLASLRPEADAGRAAVWVVDNQSDDGSPEMVEQKHPWATLVRAPDNLGFGPAVNLVARQTEHTDWIAPCNADIAFEPGALEALLAAGERDPGAGVIAPMLVGTDGHPQHCLYEFPTLGFTLLFNLGLQRLSRRWADAHCLEGMTDLERARRAPWAIGALLLVRREAWDAVGGFDDDQWMFAEDLDLGWRLQRAGWATRYEPAARVRHFGAAATGAAWGDARTERWMNATYAWMARRRGPLRTRVFAAINVTGARARWAIFGALARLQPRWRSTRDASKRWAKLHAVGLHPRAVRERRSV